MFIGVILFAIILFVTCFKRQVGRMKKRSRRDPHVPGSEAKKVRNSKVTLEYCLLLFLGCGMCGKVYMVFSGSKMLGENEKFR